MYDAVDIGAIPVTALAVAGYVDGQWPTLDRLVKAFPRARHISIATRATSVAEILDVESGDARDDEVVAWLELAHHHGVTRPGLYASLARWAQLLAVTHRAGWRRPRIKVWVAHWTGQPHICGPSCGAHFTTNAGATQYEGAAPGRPYDTSLATRTFLKV